MGQIHKSNLAPTFLHWKKFYWTTIIKNRVSIEQLPAANGKLFGDWKMDLIIGKGNKEKLDFKSPLEMFYAHL